MLFDDVTSALDPEVIGEVLGIIRQLATEHSLTMVMVIHQMGFAREISDRVCFFYEGKSAEQDDRTAMGRIAGSKLLLDLLKKGVCSSFTHAHILFLQMVLQRLSIALPPVAPRQILAI